MQKRWVVHPKISDDLKEQLLNNRAVEKSDIFLKPQLNFLTPANRLFPEIEKAVDRIKKAIKTQELIYVYGDYDVDGITGSAVLWETINFLGGRVMPYIPSRHSEGYGLHSEALEQLAKEDAKVVVSVDCGITAGEQAKIAKKLGIDLIITDHHQVQDELPKPFALVHTTTLSGSGVAMRLAERLLASFNKEKEEQFFRNLELATLGTVADMVPLTGDNRIIVANGLRLLSKTARIGLQALYSSAGLGRSVGTYEIGFIISPRLNSAGRMENALDSLRLLLTRDNNRAVNLAANLDQTNRVRQQKTQEVFEHAKKKVADDFSDKKFLVVASENYPEGVVGLVASRLVENFYRPTAVIGKGDKVFKGSARSISGFNITAALHRQEQLLVSHGGHPMAAGFSVSKENIPKLRKNLESFAEGEITSEDLVPVLRIDAELCLEKIGTQLIELLGQLEPFGVGNPEPIFLTTNLEVVEKKTLGKENEHLRLLLKDKNGKTLSGIGFGLGGLSVAVGAKVEVAYNLRENTWNGRKNIEARIKDLHKLN